MQATRALVKSVHQTPWLASTWSRLSTRLVSSNDKTSKIMTSSTLVIASNKSRTAEAQSEAYENAALAEKDNMTASKKFAQRSIISAPWRLSAWMSLTPLK